MNDVTHLFSTYRECVRHLWNTYFRPVAEPTQNWDLCDEFDIIARGIFSSLILHPVNIFDPRTCSRICSGTIGIAWLFASFPPSSTALRYSSIGTCPEVATGTIRYRESGVRKSNWICCVFSTLISWAIETSATLR